MLNADGDNLPIMPKTFPKQTPILVIGAGRSATCLIDYLADLAAKDRCRVTVADADMSLAAEKCAGRPGLVPMAFQLENKGLLEESISKHEIVISMLPAFLHPQVAAVCLLLGKHLLTASYVGAEMKAFDADAKAKGLIFLNECGLDPGLDHLSAAQIMDEIHAQGGKIHTFKSWCGGLIAPESDDNPWGYKFTWNPRNVVVAGQSTASFLEGGVVRHLPYWKVFARTAQVTVPGLGQFEGYANRDSVSYQEVYPLPGIQTLLRGTLRKAGYCAAWDVFVQLGLTDDNLMLQGLKGQTLGQLIDRFLPEGQEALEIRLQRYLPGMSAESLKRLRWLGAFDGTDSFPHERASAAAALQYFLERKWVLKQEDKDMIVMQHEFGFTDAQGIERLLYSDLIVKGESQTHTAMAKTVGWPLAIAAELILDGKIDETGVVIPLSNHWYSPILRKLASLGIQFEERVQEAN